MIHDATYLEQRQTIKKLEAATASLDLATRAWHAATMEMGRAMGVVIDALCVCATEIPGCEEQQLAEGGSSHDAPLRPELDRWKDALPSSFEAFDASVTRDARGLIESLSVALRACDELRHSRNRAEEQFHVDQLCLEKKIAAYHEKGRPLSESKKYAELVTNHEASEQALHTADSAYDGAFRHLTETVLPTARRQFVHTFSSTVRDLLRRLMESLEPQSAMSLNRPPAASPQCGVEDAVASAEGDVGSEEDHKAAADQRSTAGADQRTEEDPKEGTTSHVVAAHPPHPIAQKEEGSNACCVSSDDDSQPQPPPLPHALAHTPTGSAVAPIPEYQFGATGPEGDTSEA